MASHSTRLNGIKERSTQAVLLSLFFSFVVHMIMALFTLGLDLGKFRSEEDVTALEVTLQSLPVTETLQETSKIAPETPSFVSDRILRTDVETSPEAAGKNVVEGGGGSAADSKNMTKEQTQATPKKMTFALSQNDLQALQKQNESVPSARSGELNPGFEKRLELGESLKVNAAQMDYASYINRMKRKISQVWNPQKTYSPSMNDYQAITTTVFLILNDDGQIVHIGLKDRSLFRNFDQEALRALNESAPFPNPPVSLVQDDGRVYMPWTFTMSLRSWGVVQID